jgi:hypothetical protein
MDEHLTDPPADRKPCECSVNEAKTELRAAFTDALITHDLEWADGVSSKGADKQIDNLVDKLVAPVGWCSECRPEGDCVHD